MHRSAIKMFDWLALLLRGPHSIICFTFRFCFQHWLDIFYWMWAILYLGTGCVLIGKSLTSVTWQLTSLIIALWGLTWENNFQTSLFPYFGRLRSTCLVKKKRLLSSKEILATWPPSYQSLISNLINCLTILRYAQSNSWSNPNRAVTPKIARWWLQRKACASRNSR